MRTVSINKAMNGYVGDVGCQRLVFETRERLLQELGRYLEKPEEIEKEYAERFGLGEPPTAPLGPTLSIDALRQAAPNLAFDAPSTCLPNAGMSRG